MEKLHVTNCFEFLSMNLVCCWLGWMVKLEYLSISQVMLKTKVSVSRKLLYWYKIIPKIVQRLVNKTNVLYNISCAFALFLIKD